MAPLAAPSDAALFETLAATLAAAGSAAPRELRRRRSAYRTSFPLEELELTLEDGERLRLAFKQLDWDSLEETARIAKPGFLHDPRRELVVYAELLAPAAIGAPRFYGSVSEAERHWLFVEWVEGRELYQVGAFELWREVARWLAQMHAALAAELEHRPEPPPLLDYDAAYYRRWIERARELRGGGDPAAARILAWLSQRYEVVVEELLALPKTVIHGELYASNVLIAGDGGALRVAPVDWELAALGPGLVDLAALTSGSWSEGERDLIVAAYRDAPGAERFSARQLDLVRLHLAVQWLGWAPSSWAPPEGQRHDWLAEAAERAEGLGL